MSFSDHLENKLLDHVFGGPDYTRPATLYIGLATGVTDAGVITGEPTGGAYARVAKTNNATNFPAASGGSKSNGTVVEFPEATAAWGTMTHFFIADAAESGNVLGSGELTVSKAIATGDTPKFNVGTLTITLD